MKHELIIRELSFGAKVGFVDVPDDTLFNFRMYMNSGDQFAPPGKYEVPHILEHCLFEKNKNYKDPLEFKIEIETLGAYRNGFTSYTSNWYIINGVIENHLRLTDFLLKLVNEVDLKEDIFIKQKEVVRNELTRYKNDDKRELSTMLSQGIKPGVLLAEQRLELLDNVVFQDIVDYYNEYYVPENTIFLFSGNLKGKIEGIISLLEDYYRDKVKGAYKEIDYSISEDYPGRVAYRDVATKTSFDFIIRFVIEKDDMDIREQYVMFLNAFLYGQGSRIQNKARELGLIYTLSSASFLEKNYVNVGFSENVTGDKLIPLLKLIIDEMKDMFAGNIEDKEIERAKGFLYGNLQRSFITGESILGYYTDEIVYGEKWKNIDDYLKRVLEFTKEDIILFGKSFDFSRWMFGIIGNNAGEKSKEVEIFLRSYLGTGK